MHQFYTLSVALLATSALAAPAPKQQKDDKAAKHIGHFSAAVHGHKHKGPANPLAEMKHIFGKYDWKFDVGKFDVDIPHIDLPKIDIPKIDHPKGVPGKEKAKQKAAGLALDIADKVQTKANAVTDLVGGIADTLGSILGGGHDSYATKDTSKDSDKDSDKDDEEEEEDDDDDDKDDEATSYAAPTSTSVKPIQSTTSKTRKTRPTGTASASPVKPSSASKSASSTPAPAPPAYSPEPYYPEPSSEAPATSSSSVVPTSAAPLPSSEASSFTTHAPAPPTSEPVTSSSSTLQTVTYTPSFSFAPTTSATAVETSSAAPPPPPATSSSSAPPPPPPTTSAPPATTAVPSTSSVVVVPSSTKKSNNGKVTAAAEVNEAAYLSPVTIGGQSLNLNFDTGSADLWVFSSSLPEALRANHTAFDPSKSPTWQAADGYTWSIAYGDGSSASGTVGFDTVVVGAATATRQAVEIATTVSDKFAKDINNDGLVGLSFGSINTIKPQQQKTFFESIQPELDQPLFTADLRQDTEVSTYEFGLIDATKYKGEIHYTPVDSSRGHWEFASTTYTINGQSFTNSNAHPAIADTGTSLILADQAVVTAYYGAVQGATFNSQVGGYTYACSATLPEFGMQLGSSGFTATIPGSQMTYAPLGNGDCFGGLQSNGGGNYQILGDVLFKQYFAVFNGGEKKFGLAQKA